MKFVFAADVHLGNHRQLGGMYESGLNARARIGIDAFAEVFRLTSDVRADGLAILGDVFDDDRPSPQLVAAAQRVYKAGNDFVWTVVGNHDLTSNADGHHALAPLSPVTRIYAKPTLVCRGREDRTEIGLIPFRAEPAREYLRRDALALPWSTKGHRILGIHAGVIDKSTPPWLRTSHEGIDVDDLADIANAVGASAVFAGHWHESRLLRTAAGPTIVQVGSLVPTGFDDTSKFHGAWIWEDGAIEGKEVAGPRFVKVRNEDELAVATEWAKAHNCRLFVLWEADPDDLVGANDVVRELALGGPIVSWSVVPNGASLEASARSAADAARDATAFDEALAAFVERVPIGDGVDRARVLSLSKSYLRS